MVRTGSSTGFLTGWPTVGMVGGGQLARMTHQASIGLGVGLRVLAQSRTDSAALVDPLLDVGDHRDLAALRAFAQQCDVVTFDHEHVPTQHLEALQDDGVVIRPGPHALVHAQDKLVMRERLTAAGIPCPRWRRVESASQVAEFAESVSGWPVVLKTPRGGYDGKGVHVVADVNAAERVLETAPVLLAEEHVPFSRELAVVVARSAHGQAAAYPVVQTVQRNGICVEVIAPAPDISEQHALAAQRAALDVAAALDVIGVLAVEMFDAPDSAGGVLVNELAMRPHNSGHWTIDGACTSQFEQHLRAVLDLPLGDTSMTATWVVMANVLGGAGSGPGDAAGDLYRGYPHVMARDPGARVHAYGKQVRPGRKIGHVTVAGTDLEDVRERARHAAGWLRGDVNE